MTGTLHPASVVAAILLGAAALCPAAPAPDPADPNDKPAARPVGTRGPGVPAFTVRPGYRVAVVADKLAEARFLEFDNQDTLYVSQPDAGTIVALRDEDEDGAYEKSTPFVSGRPKAHAMQFHDGWLWFAQSGSIHRARDKDNDGKADEVITVIPEGQLPGGTGHWWRSLLVTGDALYTSIGDSENISDETKTDRQKIWKFDHKGGGKTLFATGIRNTEELRLRPGTGEVWGVDHGSDWFGKPLGETEQRLPVTSANPPDEFNRYDPGQFYGHPFVTGNRLPRIEFFHRKDILDLAAKTVPPQWTFGAHWSANGWTFLTKDAFPGHKGDAFVACRGSWNSEEKVGYRVQRVLFDAWTGLPYGSQMIVGTLSEDGKQVLARPVDCVEAPDGAVLFSCDVTKRVYRITHDQHDNRGH